jgi:hypothetical protein
MHFFSKIGEVDLERILLEIDSLDFESQILLQGTHKNQDPKELVSKIDTGATNAWERKQNASFTANDVIQPLFNIPYTNQILEKFKLGYTRLMVLHPKTCYTYHIDKSNRVHIPIITNENNFFVIEDSVFRLPANGSVYEVNTTKKHTFVNASLETRIHIVGLYR